MFAKPVCFNRVKCVCFKDVYHDASITDHTEEGKNRTWHDGTVVRSRGHTRPDLAQKGCPTLGRSSHSPCRFDARVARSLKVEGAQVCLNLYSFFFFHQAKRPIEARPLPCMLYRKRRQSVLRCLCILLSNGSNFARNLGPLVHGIGVNLCLGFGSTRVTTLGQIVFGIRVILCLDIGT